jgi:toxin ParE1/3/4
MQVQWTESAWQDLEALVVFIARDSVRYADDVADAVVARITDLRTFPTQGRVVPEFGSPAVREVFHHPYRIIYRCDAERIVIIAIIHGARDLSTLWRRDHRDDPRTAG